MSTETPTSTSNKKKWLIGCGGCLGVLLIIAVILVLGAGSIFKNVMQASNKSVEAIFGKYTPPAGYVALGLPTGQKEVKNMVLLMEPQRNLVIVALDTLTSEKDTRILKSGDSKQIEEYIRRVGQEANKSASSSASSSKMDLDKVRFEKTETVTLPNGKRFPLIHAVMRSERQGADEYSPSAVTLLPTGQNRMVILFALDAAHSSADANAHFSTEHKTLRNEVTEIIQDSELDDKLSG